LRWAFQERGCGGGGRAGAAADGADRVPDEVGDRDPGRRLQVEEVRQEVRQEQSQPKVWYIIAYLCITITHTVLFTKNTTQLVHAFRDLAAAIWMPDGSTMLLAAEWLMTHSLHT